MSIIRVSSHGLGNSLLLVLDLYLCDGPSDNIMATRGDLENITPCQEESHDMVKKY